MVLLAFLLPCLATAYLLVFHRKALTWWEPVVLLAACGLLVFLCSLAADSVPGYEHELRGGWVVSADDVQAWDETVPCRHPKYRTETYTDSEGNLRTRQVQDGYMHAYDVDYHPEHWVLNDSNGVAHRTDAGTWARLRKSFSNAGLVDMHRDYHSIDGDIVRSTYPGDESVLEPTYSRVTYRNKTQYEGSVFNYTPPDSATAARYGLYAWPGKQGHTARNVLGYESTSTVLIDRLDAVLGAPKHVRVLVLVYRGRPVEASFQQERLWRGGRRNELVVCVGLGPGDRVEWSRAFSWSESENVKVGVRDYLSAQDRFDLAGLAGWLRTEVSHDWRARDFEDFDYLKPPPPAWAVVLAWLLVGASSVGMAIWVVINEYGDLRGWLADGGGHSDPLHLAFDWCVTQYDGLAERFGGRRYRRF